MDVVLDEKLMVIIIWGKNESLFYAVFAREHGLFTNCFCDIYSSKHTESVLRLLRKFCMVAVLEVPDSPTSTTGLFTFTICSNSQLARVVSTVGTERKQQIDKYNNILKQIY